MRLLAAVVVLLWVARTGTAGADETEEREMPAGPALTLEAKLELDADSAITEAQRRFNKHLGDAFAAAYSPSLHYGAHAGAVAESTGYLGAAVGLEADLAAPICRYVGGAINGQAYRDGEGPGLAWDARLTACLPTGLWAIEVGLISQRDVRVGLAARPTVTAGRFSALGFEVNVRLFRILQQTREWDIVPMTIRYLDLAPAASDVQAATFSATVSILRHYRYGKGVRGGDALLEIIPYRVQGKQDAFGAMQNATAVGMGLVAVEELRLAPSLWLDANAMFQIGRTGSTTSTEDDIALTTPAIDIGLHADVAGVLSSVRYQRGFLPDDRRRLLLEDRGEVAAEFGFQSFRVRSTAFAARTRTAAVPEGVATRASSFTAGAELEVGRVLHGPFYVTASGEVARSLYPEVGADVADTSELAARAMVGIAATFGSSR